MSMLRRCPSIKLHTNLLDCTVYVFAPWVVSVLQVPPSCLCRMAAPSLHRARTSALHALATPVLLQQGHKGTSCIC